MENKLHLVKLLIVCTEKRKGGLGIKCLSLFSTTCYAIGVSYVKILDNRKIRREILEKFFP